MNAKEQMEALLNKNIVACEGSYYKLNDRGDLVVCYGPLEDGEWGENACPDFFFDEANYVFDDSKCVDFAHALGRMAQGKVMICLWSGELFRIAEGTLQTCNDDNWQSIVKGELLEDDEMESMWMEVE